MKGELVLCNLDSRPYSSLILPSRHWLRQKRANATASVTVIAIAFLSQVDKSVVRRYQLVVTWEGS